MLSFFLRDVLDEIWDLIESVSEGFPSYFFNLTHNDNTERQVNQRSGGIIAVFEITGKRVILTFCKYTVISG